MGSSTLGQWPVWRFKDTCEWNEVAPAAMSTSLNLRPDQLSAFQRTAQEVESLISELEELVEPLPFAERHRPISPDPDDDVVLEAAINGRADLILSHNIRHLREAAARFKIEVVTPQEFLQLLRHEESACKANPNRNHRAQ